MSALGHWCCLACAVSGLVADARTMVDKARVEAQVLHANT